MRLHRPILLVVALGLFGCGKKDPTPAPVPSNPSTPSNPANPAPTPSEADAAPAAATPDAAPAPAAEADAVAQAAPDAAAPAAPDAAAPAPTDDATAAAPADAALIARGAFIAGISGCPQCHTPFGPNGPDMAKAWAGGLEVPEAFGTWRSPNITQDKKTGIGGWTDEEILASVREGKRPDGSGLYPVMPWPFYHRMSDDDGKALVAFLRTIAPIENAVAGNTDLKLPKMELPKPAGTPPGPEPLAQGEYLATLMHCGACHTPMTDKGPDMSRWLAGGMKFEMPFLGEGAVYASNLTPHATGIGEWTDAELITALRDMKRKDGSPIMGPMAMYQATWSQIPEAELGHIVAYIRSVPPVDNAVPKSDFKSKGPLPGAPATP